MAGVEGDVGIAGVEVGDPLDRFDARGGHRAPVVQLCADVAQQSLVARDHDFGRPSLGTDAEQLELDGEQRGVGLGLGDVGVHAVHVRGDDQRAAIVVVVHLLGHVAAEAEEAEADVALELAGAQHFGDGARGLRAPDLELEEAVAGGGVPLGEEEVVLGLGVDVVDSPPVANDLDRGVEAGNGQALARRGGLGRCAGWVGGKGRNGGQQGGGEQDGEG